MKTNVNIGTFVTTTPKATTVIKPTPKATTIDNMIEAIKAVVAKAGTKTVKASQQTRQTLLSAICTLSTPV